MTALATLTTETVSVDPGGEASCEIKVKNVGNVVQQFHLSVLGDAEEWAAAEPAMLRLFPNDEGTARIVFRPPKSWEVPPGEVDFAVKVTPETEPEGATVEEGTVTVGRFDDLAAELLPLVTRSRRRTRHRIAIDSRGNAEVRATLQAIDPADELSIRLVPATLTLQPGKATFASVRVKPRKPTYKGADKSHPFKVLIGPDGMATIELDGTMVQRPLLPKALIPIAALAALVLLWLALVKPTLETAAKDAVADPIAEVTEQNENLKKDVDAANEKLDEAAAATTTTSLATIADDSAATSLETTTTLDTTTTTSTVAGGSGAAGGEGGATAATGFDGRLDVVAGPGETRSAIYTVPAGKTLSITDIVLQNASGSAGEVRVQRQTATSTSDLLTTRLETFTDKDYHFSSPLVFKAGENVRLLVDCRSGQGACSVGMLFTGTQS